MYEISGEADCPSVASIQWTAFKNIVDNDALCPSAGEWTQTTDPNDDERSAVEAKDQWKVSDFPARMSSGCSAALRLTEEWNRLSSSVQAKMSISYQIEMFQREALLSRLELSTAEALRQGPSKRTSRDAKEQQRRLTPEANVEQESKPPTIIAASDSHEEPPIFTTRVSPSSNFQAKMSISHQIEMFRREAHLSRLKLSTVEALQHGPSKLTNRDLEAQQQARIRGLGGKIGGWNRIFGRPSNSSSSTTHRQNKEGQGRRQTRISGRELGGGDAGVFVQHGIGVAKDRPDTEELDAVEGDDGADNRTSKQETETTSGQVGSDDRKPIREEPLTRGEETRSSGPSLSSTRRSLAVPHLKHRSRTTGHASIIQDDILWAIERLARTRWSTAAAKENRAQSLSFRKFTLLSVAPETLAMIGDDRIIDDGPRFLDPFIVDVTADLLDEFSGATPEDAFEHHDGSDLMEDFPLANSPRRIDDEREDSLDSAALSTFCFPDGLRVRIVPRAAMMGVRRLGWAGEGADQYQLLAFTDGCGVTSHGVVVKVREEITCSSDQSAIVDTLARLSWQRRRRAAASLLCRWWRKCCMRAPRDGFLTSVVQWAGMAKRKEGDGANDGISAWAREKGAESYQAMLCAEELGDVCLVEKSYVMVGGRSEDQALLLAALQQVVDLGRQETLLRLHESPNAATDAVPLTSMQRSMTSPCHKFQKPQIFHSPLARQLNKIQRTQRHVLLTFIQKNLTESNKQAGIDYPESHLEHVYDRKEFFEISLPIPNARPIKLPLPLPQVAKQWGFAKLLLTIGPDSLMVALKLLLLERSILVLGERPDEVTAACQALVELLKPFDWVSTFMPVLPYPLLDFVLSPVPFVAGMAAEKPGRMFSVIHDYRVLEAMTCGMSLLNLTTGALVITTEEGIKDNLGIPPHLQETLLSFHSRIQSFSSACESSALRSFQKFVRCGMAPKESVTLQAASSTIEAYINSLTGAHALNRDGWKRYGRQDFSTGFFEFYPSWFIDPIRVDLHFQEAVVKTQLFSSYVEEKAKDHASLTDAEDDEV